MDQSDLSTLADTGPCHDTHPMPFDSVDVARVARAVEAKPNRLTKALFGLNPRGLGHLLRKLWLAGEKTAGELATVSSAFDMVSAENKEYRHRVWDLEATVQQQKGIMYALDRVIAAYGEKKSGVLIITENQMFRLDDEYDCPDRKRASTGERWAYTYRGYRVFTAREIAGPVMMSPAIFESFKLNLGKAVTLRER